MYGAENEYPLCRQSDNRFGRRRYDRRLKGYSYTIYLLRLLGIAKQPDGFIYSGVLYCKTAKKKKGLILSPKPNLLAVWLP